MTGRPKTAAYTQAPPNYGDIMTVADYLEGVEDGMFTDYDGHGDVMKDGLVAVAPANERTGWPDWIKPSDGDRFIPEDATHILWFNR